jgi:predicted outer membrane protein
VPFRLVVLASGPMAAETEAEPTGEDPPEEKEAAMDAAAEPSDARLAQVQAAFERGDYAQVRELAAPLVAEGGPLGESAADLVQRTKVDPAQVGVLLGCLIFFCYIVWKYVL